MRVIIAGSRSLDSDEAFVALCSAMEELERALGKPTLILSGAARGMDGLGESWAHSHEVQVARYPADWSLGKYAGVLRNGTMIALADALVLVWDGESKGSADVLAKARAKPIPVFERIVKP